MLHFEATDWDCNVMLCSLLEGKEWGLHCDVMFCVVRQRMGTVV